MCHKRKNWIIITANPCRPLLTFPLRYNSRNLSPAIKHFYAIEKPLPLVTFHTSFLLDLPALRCSHFWHAKRWPKQICPMHQPHVGICSQYADECGINWLGDDVASYFAKLYLSFIWCSVHAGRWWLWEEKTKIRSMLRWKRLSSVNAVNLHVKVLDAVTYCLPFIFSESWKYALRYYSILPTQWEEALSQSIELFNTTHKYKQTRRTRNHDDDFVSRVSSHLAFFYLIRRISSYTW